MFWVVFFGIIFIAIVANVAYRMKTGKRWVVENESSDPNDYLSGFYSGSVDVMSYFNGPYDDDTDVVSNPAYSSLGSNIYNDD